MIGPVSFISVAFFMKLTFVSFDVLAAGAVFSAAISDGDDAAASGEGEDEG